jgi:hypothetical protein
MLPPGSWQPVGIIVHVLYREPADTWGKRVLPVVIWNAECALEIDSAACPLMDFRKPEGELVFL